MSADSQSSAEAGTRRSRGGPVLIGALLVDSVGNGLFLPLGLIYFTRVTPVSLATVGVLLSVANLLQLPVPLLSGALADRIGAMRLVSLAQVLQAIGYGAAVFASNPATILLSASMTAIGVRVFWSCIFTAVADYVDGSPGGRSKDHWYAWTNMSRTAGLGVGGLLTGLAMSLPGADAHTYRVIAVGAAVCFALAGAANRAWVRAPRTASGDSPTLAGYLELLRDRPYLGLIAANTVYAVSTMMLALTLPTVVLVELRGPTWVVSCLLVATTVLVALATAPVINRLGGFRRTRVVAAAGACWAVWSLGLALLRPGHPGWGVPLLAVAALFYCAATIIHAPVSMGLAEAASPPAARGRYLASFQYSFTLAEIIAPAFFTSLFALWAGLPWLALALVNILTALGVIALERRLPAAAVRLGGPPEPESGMRSRDQQPQEVP
ncbi:MAG TPA: MFS transporter [Actinospica sp.]|nr:MFS transporter [Actinospica sp.]